MKTTASAFTIVDAQKELCPEIDILYQCGYPPNVFVQPNEQSQTYLNFVMDRKRLMLIERWNHAQKNHVMRVKRASPRARRLVGMLFFNYSIGRHERVDDRPNGFSNSLHRAYQKSVGSFHRRCSAAAIKMITANIQEHSSIGIVHVSSPIISIGLA